MLCVFWNNYIRDKVMKKSIINHIRRNQRERVAENQWEAAAAKIAGQRKSEKTIRVDIAQLRGKNFQAAWKVRKMKFNIKRPCTNCPFRKDRPMQRGWLGYDRAKEIAQGVLQ